MSKKSNFNGEDLNDRMKALVLPPDDEVGVCLRVPEAAGRGIDTGAILLNYSTGN